MPACALIVAIEDYPKTTTLAQNLPGTTDCGSQFYRWLRDKQGLAPEQIYVCGDKVSCDGGSPKSAATKADIVAAVDALITASADQVQQLYVFLAGHGVAYTEKPGRRPPDQLLGAEATALKKSGAAMINVEELQDVLSTGVGGNQHFYFIDMCRQVASQSEVIPTGTGLNPDQAKTSGDVSIYTLFSTQLGSTAAGNDTFGVILNKALRGSGRAKAWLDDDLLWVTFGGVSDEVRRKLKHQLPVPQMGLFPGKMLRLQPTPESTLEVRVRSAAADESFELRFGSVVGLKLQSEPIGFTGPTMKQVVAPNDYRVTVTQSGAALRRVGAVGDEPIDLFDSAEVEFLKSGPPPAAAPAPPSTRMIVESAPAPAITPKEMVRELEEAAGDDAPDPIPAPPPMPMPKPDYVMVNVIAPRGDGLRVSMTRWSDGKQWPIPVDSAGRAALQIEPGRYRLEASQQGTPFRARDVDANHGQVEVDLRQQLSDPQLSVRARVDGSGGGGPLLSESLGFLAQDDLGFWLMLIGASRITRAKTEGHRLNALHLDWFDTLPAGQSAIFVLSAFPSGLTQPPRVGIDQPVSEWKVCEPIVDLHHIYQWRDVVAPRPRLLSLAWGAQTVCVSTVTIPNHVTLVTMSPSERSERLRIQQVMLPARAHFGQLPPNALHPRMEKGDLSYVWKVFSAIEAFARRRPWRELCEQVAKGDWRDPLLCTLLGYEAIRRGEKQWLERSRELLAGLAQWIPDVAVLNGAKLEGTPLIRDAWTVVRQKPPAGGRVRYSGVWTCWDQRCQSPIEKPKAVEEALTAG